MRWIFLICLISVSFQSVQARIKKKEKPKYRTYFGSCPSRSAGKLSLKTIEIFEQNRSLKQVKEVYLEEGYKDKYFLSSYKIDYDPMKNFLYIKFDCPKPLMKVQVYKKNGTESYSAILVETGKLVDPSYEILLKSEGKLHQELPFLALPLKEIDSFNQQLMADSISVIPKKYRKNLSEIIMSESGDLTFILSVKAKPISAFMGKEHWTLKIEKLFRIVDHFYSKRSRPAIINLTNHKKVVVKFNDKF
jgi:hypothetical protein